MMNKFFVTVGQIVVGVTFARVTTEVLDKVVMEPIRKVIDSKMEKKEAK